MHIWAGLSRRDNTVGGALLWDSLLWRQVSKGYEYLVWVGISWRVVAFPRGGM